MFSYFDPGGTGGNKRSRLAGRPVLGSAGANDGHNVGTAKRRKRSAAG